MTTRERIHLLLQQYGATSKLGRMLLRQLAQADDDQQRWHAGEFTSLEAMIEDGFRFQSEHPDVPYRRNISDFEGSTDGK